MSSRRLLAVFVGVLVVGLLIAAPILSGDDLAVLDPTALEDGRIDIGAVDAVHENTHVHPVVLADRGVAVAWIDPRWDGAAERFPGALTWQAAEGLTAIQLVDPASGQPAPWCLTSALFEVESTGTAFNDLGEWVAGPVSQGLARYAIELVDDRVIVDTTIVLPGPPAEGRLGYQGARGPRCVPS